MTFRNKTKVTVVITASSKPKGKLQITTFTIPRNSLFTFDETATEGGQLQTLCTDAGLSLNGAP